MLKIGSVHHTISYVLLDSGGYSARSNGMAMGNNDAGDLNRVRRRMFEAVDRGQINGQR